MHAWTSSRLAFVALFTMRAEISGLETRNLKLLSILPFKNYVGQRTFYYRTVSLWNSLERNLKLSECMSVLRRRLLGKLLREFFYIRNTILSLNFTIFYILRWFIPFYDMTGVVELCKSYRSNMNKVLIYARPCVNEMTSVFLLTGWRVFLLFSCSAVFLLFKIWKKPAKNFPIFLSALPF